MIIVFTGGRNYGERLDNRGAERELGLAEKEIQRFKQTFPLFKDAKIYVGCARGLDSLVRETVKDARVHRANWLKHGKMAGPLRNGEMLAAALRESVETQEVVLLVAYPGGAGTADCVRQAIRAGIPVLKVEA